MNVSITGRKIKITPEIRNYIEKKMKKLDNYFNHIVDFRIIVNKEKHSYMIEVNINVKKRIIHVFTKSEDVFSAIDILFDKVDIKMRRYHDKLVHRRYSTQRVTPQGEIETVEAS